MMAMPLGWNRRSKLKGNLPRNGQKGIVDLPGSRPDGGSLHGCPAASTPMTADLLYGPTRSEPTKRLTSAERAVPGAPA